MFQFNRIIFQAGFLCLALAGASAAQTDPPKPGTNGETVKTEAAKKEEKKDDKKSQQTIDPSKYNVEQVAESAIIVYSGNILGRVNLNQIRKTTFERGRLSVTDAKGKTEAANYERWIMRGETLNKERVRFDQIYPDTTYSLIYNGEKVFGIYKDSVFAPREDASLAFRSQIWHGLDALLRYKENGSTIELAGRDKIMGVEYFLVDVTDSEKRKTRFYVSLKTFRVMFLDYEEGGVKYRRKFYDYRYAQGTLVPYRTVLLEGERQLEEMTIGTITFGQKIEDNMFAES